MRWVAVTLGLGFSLISTAHAVPLKYDYSAPPVSPAMISSTLGTS